MLFQELFVVLFQELFVVLFQELFVALFQELFVALFLERLVVLFLEALSPLLFPELPSNCREKAIRESPGSARVLVLALNQPFLPVCCWPALSISACPCLRVLN